MWESSGWIFLISVWAGSLDEISWDEFFDKFDKSRLALVYQEKTADGQRSNFNKLVKRK